MNSRMTLCLFLLASLPTCAGGSELPPNRWVEIRRDEDGARRGSAIRYASGAKAFFLWGFHNSNQDLLQERPLMQVPEYDVVSFDPAAGRWMDHLPRQMESEWSRTLPLAYVPRTYSGITTGSERTVMRSTSDDQGAVPRPDLNIVFDQTCYRPPSNTLYYFTGGLTAMYDVGKRRWSDLRPAHSPPPVLGGSLEYDPIHDEVVLFGGGHIAERGADGAVRGYTGTWAYSIRDNHWRMLPPAAQPPPRMNTRMVLDSRNQVLVLFGGDGHKSYLADTWLFDLKTRAWRPSRANAVPPPRAGHFTVYDPETGLVIIGGGYNRQDLTDMWGYDAGQDRWQRLAGEVPTGFYLSADIASERRLILLVTANRKADDQVTCNVLYPVRTTYAYRIGKEAPLLSEQAAGAHSAMSKRPMEEMKGADRSPPRREEQAKRLAGLPVNRWVLLDRPGREAPTRTWGSATFDTDRGLILYWGGGHCGYEGSDVDGYDVAEHTWRGEAEPEYPERLWNHGVRLAGVTFGGRPWANHGRKVFAYDPVSRKLIIVEPIRLTTGYEAAWLRAFPTKDSTAPDALVRAPSSYRRFVTWSYDPDTQEWKILGPAPAGLDTFLTTPDGVVGVPVNWPGRLNDAGYQLPWRPEDPPEDNALFLLRGSRWERLSGDASSPQNLYEMTSLAYDSKRDRVLLHGGGQKRDELWSFDLKSRRWSNLRPRVLAPEGGAPPACTREAVYLPGEDVLLIYGNPRATWVYNSSDNAWRQIDLPVPEGDQRHGGSGQNRAMLYDAKRDVVLLVLGAGGDTGRASVYALKYRNAEAAVKQKSR